MEINTGNLPYSEAAERNQAPILSVLEAYLPDRGRVLEIGSGTGQHIVAFARQFPKLSWQASDQPDALATVTARVAEADRPNLNKPIALDVQQPWPQQQFDMIYSANTLHIMPWDAGRQLIAKAPDTLTNGGFLVIYGPFLDPAIETAPSNLAFHQSLQSRDPAMGLRRLDAVQSLAAEAGLQFKADHVMPANNRLLVWHKH